MAALPSLPMTCPPVPAALPAPEDPRPDGLRVHELRRELDRVVSPPAIVQPSANGAQPAWLAGGVVAVDEGVRPLTDGAVLAPKTFRMSSPCCTVVLLPCRAVLSFDQSASSQHTRGVTNHSTADTEFRGQLRFCWQGFTRLPFSGEDSLADSSSYLVSQRLFRDRDRKSGLFAH